MMENDKPDIWRDDTRMSVLFSPLRERSLNPSSWTQKVDFWIQMINNDCVQCGKLIIDQKSLEIHFRRKGKVPQCIKSVLQEMLRLEKLKKYSDRDCLQSNTKSLDRRKGWITWGVDTFLRTPINWGWTALKGDEEEIQYIVIDALHRLSDLFLQRQYEKITCHVTDSVCPYTELWETHKAWFFSEMDFNTLLQQLQVEKKITVQKEDSEILIKFMCKDEKEVKLFCDRDIQIHRMKSTSDMLINQIQKLSCDITRLKKEALCFKKQNKTQQALRSLRQYKRVQKRMEQLTQSLDMLDDLLWRIRHAVSDDMVLKALENGAEALKGLTNKVDLDHVANVMDNVKEAIEDQEDIQAEMSISHQLHDTSEDELEKELQDLINGDSSGSKEKLPSPLKHKALRENELSDFVNEKGEKDVEKSNSMQFREELHNLPRNEGILSTCKKDEDLLAALDQFEPSNVLQPNKEDKTGVEDLTDLLSGLQFPDVPKFSPSKTESNKTKTKQTELAS